MRNLSRTLKDGLLLVARVITGAVLVLHGWARWDQGVTAQKMVLQGLGVPFPEVVAPVTIGFELIGGIVLALGLLTRLVGLVLVLEQVAIVFYAKWAHGPYLTDNGWEANAGLAALGLVWMAVGSGRAGVDALLRRPDRERHEIDDNDPVE